VGATNLASLPGVECLNPGAPEAERRYVKFFGNKEIYLHDQYEKAVSALVGRYKDNVIVGMNGYGALPPERCAAWGVKPGAYEAACSRLLFEVTQRLRAEYPGVNVLFAHGASNCGVDSSIIAVARKLNVPNLGHSYPDFMFYVDDLDEVPIYVADTKEAYAEAFIKTLDILIAANGGEHAFQHDINAVFRLQKHLITFNVLKALSDRGGPPAVNANGKIEDAVAAFQQRFYSVGQMIGVEVRDPWKAAVTEVTEVAVKQARGLLSPERALGI
jgi:hypothetical protein